MLAAALKSLLAMSASEALAVIQGCGLRGVEIEADVGIDPSWLRELGLMVTTIDATGLDPAATGWLERLSPALRAARELDCKIVLVSAGDDQGDPARRDALLQQHRCAAERAGECGLVLAFDTLPGLCSDTREMVRLLEQLQNPAVRLNFDTGRYLQQNPWSSGEVALQRVFGQLASVRLTTFTVGVEPLEYPPLGRGGDVDFSRTWQILSGLSFAGPCTIAFRPATKKPPSAEQCEAWLRESVQHLRGCGWTD